MRSKLGWMLRATRSRSIAVLPRLLSFTLTFEPRIQALIRPYGKELKFYEVFLAAQGRRGVKGRDAGCGRGEQREEQRSRVLAAAFDLQREAGRDKVQSQKASGIASYFKRPIKDEEAGKVELKHEEKKLQEACGGRDDDKPLSVVKEEISKISRETLSVKEEDGKKIPVKQEVRGSEHQAEGDSTSSPSPKRRRQAGQAESAEVVDLTASSSHIAGGSDRKEEKESLKKEKRQVRDIKSSSPSKSMSQKSISSYFTPKDGK
eukprot:746558-Hanusia_phi.AAC.2